MSKYSLDTRKPGTGQHVECYIKHGGTIIEAEDIHGQTIFHMYLEPAQALALLKWLSAHHGTLEELAEEQKGE